METLLRAEHLVKEFPVRRGVVHAVSDVSFEIVKGETLCVVGESGCGKSTLGRLLLRLIEPTSGKVFMGGDEVTALSPNALREARRRMQMIFQDPYASLDPRMTVGKIIREPLDTYAIGSLQEREARVRELMEKVGIRPEFISRYPHQFSGGQRQRIGIARALIVRPDFVLCDEPISALDVSIQAQVVNLLEDLQAEMGLTYLFVAHDLSMVRHISRRIGVMYMGHMVEISPSKELYKNPLHPYTRALLSAIPIPDPNHAKEVKRIALSGDLPSPSQVATGCPFRTRCPHAMPKCSESAPELREMSPGHQVACFL